MTDPARNLDPAADLDAWLDAALAPEDAPGDVADAAADGGGWTITDEGAADWVLRKVRRALADVAAREAQLAVRREALDRYDREVVQPIRDEAARWERLLVAWHRRQLEDDPKAPKTVKLPSGQVKSRAGRDRVEVVDEAAFLAWAAEHAPELVRVSRSADRAAVKRRLGDDLVAADEAIVTDAGEVVPGVAHVEGDRTFTVEPDTDA